MPVHNADIAAVFEEIADLLEIGDANPFRVRAYRNAARTIESPGRDMRSLVEAETDLTRLSGMTISRYWPGTIFSRTPGRPCTNRWSANCACFTTTPG
jgi:hypothetical protein